jgi:hypothetical protein
MEGLAGGAPKRDTNVVLLLTLFLMLLAFFAVLSSLAAPQRARSKAVSASLSQTFRGAPDDAAVAREPLARALAAAVENFESRDRIAPRIVGERIQIAMPANALFELGEARLKPEAARFAAEVGRALGTSPPGWRYEAEVVIGGRPYGPAAPDLPADLALSRAYDLGRALARAGAPPSLGVGVSPEGESTVILAVRVIEAVP